MNVTFLIGNGFDLNLGLATQYSDFLKEYLVDHPDDNDEIKRFKEDIRHRDAEDQASGVARLWSNAELAFGRYTDDVVKEGKNVKTYFERYDNFCRNMAKYLQKQEKRINVEGKGQSFIDSLQDFHTGLSEKQRLDVDKAEVRFTGGYTFNFIIYNYTEIIDKIIDDIKRNPHQFGKRTVSQSTLDNSIGRIIHVHGTTTKDMVFGVNDESQIGNMKLFDGVSQHYLNSLIKQKTNQGNEARIDEKTLEIINTSSCFYIYGMSMGATDAIWWERIIKRMQAQEAVHVYIYGYDAPKETLMQRDLWLYSEDKKLQFLSFVKGADGLMNRIHIVSANIFEAFRNTALPIPSNDREDSSQEDNVAV